MTQIFPSNLVFIVRSSYYMGWPVMGLTPLAVFQGGVAAAGPGAGG
jgi:hypothetical protein